LIGGFTDEVEPAQKFFGLTHRNIEYRFHGLGAGQRGLVTR
jgi:hypothetical protein